MGSDSFCGNGTYAMTVARPKIFKRFLSDGDMMDGDCVLLGSSGDFRGDAILRTMILPDYKHSDYPEEWMFKLVEVMRVEFMKRGYACKENEQESHDLQVLVGVKGRIFSVWQDYDVVENKEDYMAIGSGIYVALGSLHATVDHPCPGARVEMALEAAAAHNAYVRPPFHVESI